MRTDLHIVHVFDIVDHLLMVLVDERLSSSKIPLSPLPSCSFRLPMRCLITEGADIRKQESTLGHLSMLGAL